MEDVKTKFLTQAEELWEKHGSKIHEIIESSEDRSENVTFTAIIDLSESVGLLKIRIGYSEVFKDERSAELETPDQPGLFKTTDDNEPAKVLSMDVDKEPEPKPKRGRKKKEPSE